MHVLKKKIFLKSLNKNNTKEADQRNYFSLHMVAQDLYT